MKKLICIFGILLVCSVSHADNFLLSKLATYTLMQNLKLSPLALRQTEIQEITTDQDIDIVKMLVHSEALPSVQLFLRGPAGFLTATDYSYQTLFIASGFFTGASGVQLLGDIPKTVVIGYEYPYSTASILQDPAKLLHTFRVTAGQIALSLKWVTQQKWVKPNKTIAMGVSLGGLFLPTALHIAQEMNVSVSHVVFGFTGADLKAILTNNLKDQVSTNIADSLSFVIPAVNALNDPQLHLPYLKGQFLVVHAEQDQVIPREATEELFDLLPQPKSKIMLQGKHIDTTQTELIMQTKNAILSWLRY